MAYNPLNTCLPWAFQPCWLWGLLRKRKQQQEEKEQPSEQRDESQPALIYSIYIVRDYRPMLADAVDRRNPDMRIDREASRSQDFAQDRRRRVFCKERILTSVSQSIAETAPGGFTQQYR